MAVAAVLERHSSADLWCFMKLESMTLKNFKSFSCATVHFEDELTTLVGENGSGKSTIGGGLELLSSQFQIPTPNWRYGKTNSRLSVSLSLTQDEIDTYLIGPIINNLTGAAKPKAQQVQTWLNEFGSLVSLETEDDPNKHAVEWKDVHFHGNYLYMGDLGERTSEKSFSNLLTSDTWLMVLRREGATTRYDLGTDAASHITQLLRHRLIVIPDFRHRNEPGARTPDVQALDGTKVASTLLNLRTHADDAQQLRYQKITNVFHELFPQFTIQAIELGPGSGQADVRFTTTDTQNNLSLSQVSAGLQESLALVTNLVAREGLLYFIEHPENHLHPHAIRAFGSLLTSAAETNQIIIATHSPYLISPSNIESIRRLWLSQSSGTNVGWISRKSIDPGSPEGAKLAGRINTAFRSIESREAVFARAVLLVEDESQYEFVKQIANKVVPTLDSLGISVIYTGGHNGFATYVPVLEGLSIPFIALRDLPWNDDTKYPPEQFMSLGMELEDYLDQEGLGESRAQIVEEYGYGSKRRTAQFLGGTIDAEDIPVKFIGLFNKLEALVGGGNISATEGLES